MAAQPQECQFCHADLRDPKVPAGVDPTLFSICLWIVVDGREVAVCPFCRRVVQEG